MHFHKTAGCPVGGCWDCFLADLVTNEHFNYKHPSALEHERSTQTFCSTWSRSINFSSIWRNHLIGRRQRNALDGVKRKFENSQLAAIQKRRSEAKTIRETHTQLQKQWEKNVFEGNWGKSSINRSCTNTRLECFYPFQFYRALGGKKLNTIKLFINIVR